jgi:hypothetical protein
MELRDPEIRRQLRVGLERRVAGRRHSMVVDELGILLGQIRADVAVITPELLIGYEIKSDFDSLLRLSDRTVAEQRVLGQMAGYDRVFDRNYLICGNKSAEKVLKLLPPHWGLTTITAMRVNLASGKPGDDYKLSFRLVREAQAHDGVDPVALAQLLWKDEALQELMLRGLGRGMKSANKERLHARVAEVLSLDELRATVARRLTLRQSWRD